MGCSKSGVCQLCTSSCCVSHLQPGQDAMFIHQRAEQFRAHNVRNLFSNSLTSANSLLLAHCTSCAKNHFCRQKENWHQFHSFLNPSSATANKDSPGFSSRFSEAFQTIYFLRATEGSWSDRPQRSASNEQITQSPFPRLKTRSMCSAPLQILQILSCAWECQDRCDQRRLEHCRITTTHQLLAGVQDLEEHRPNCCGLIIPSSCLIKILSTLFRIQSSVTVQ